MAAKKTTNVKMNKTAKTALVSLFSDTDTITIRIGKQEYDVEIKSFLTQSNVINFIMNAVNFCYDEKENISPLSIRMAEWIFTLIYYTNIDISDMKLDEIEALGRASVVEQDSPYTKPFNMYLYESSKQLRDSYTQIEKMVNQIYEAQLKAQMQSKIEIDRNRLIIDEVINRMIENVENPEVANMVAETLNSVVDTSNNKESNKESDGQ